MVDKKAKAMKTDVILYELNEVPWNVVDQYVSERPGSNIAALIDGGQSLTTHHDDSEHLMPWRTWPSLHTSSYDHNSYDLGQDPATFRGDTIWDVAENAGLSVGLFGPLQSWPAREFHHGGFFVPDTFSQDSTTYPQALQRFQAFNLSMTGENNFSSDAPLSLKTLAGTALDLVRHGLTSSSAYKLASHLAHEQKDDRYKALRPAMQVLPCFDLYWRLHRKHRPRFSAFFTNHVASMMHRYWGDGMPGYSTEFNYVPDEVYGSFITTAMDFTDWQLGRIRKYVDRHPTTMLVIAASMGQGPVESTFTDGGLFVLEDHNRLISRLGLKPATLGLTMFPFVALVFDDESAARDAVAPLESVTIGDGTPLFAKIRLEGKTVAFVVHSGDETAEMSSPLRFSAGEGHGTSSCLPADLGLDVRQRVGGANTGYHIPEGMLLTYGAGVSHDPSRKQVDVLDVAPSLLSNVLGVDPAPSMKGLPSLFT